MAVTRKPDIRRFWLMVGVLFVAGCTAPAVVGYWTDTAAPVSRMSRPESRVAIAPSAASDRGEWRIEAPDFPARSDTSSAPTRATFVALGGGTTGSRIPDPETPSR